MAAHTPLHPGDELLHWVATQQLSVPLVLRHLTWRDAVRLAVTCPQLWPHVELLVALAKPDLAAAVAPTTPDRLRIPLLTGLTAADIRVGNNWALRRACANGHLKVAQWMTATFGLTADDAQAMNNYALKWACARGHLAVAQWLTATFGLTAADARTRNNYVLREACAHGHLAVAQWLETTFGITRAEIAD